MRQDGHYICIITGRDNGEYCDPYGMTKEWLDNNLIQYDKLILMNSYTKNEKAIQCLENNIDVMIDDSIGNCKCCIESGIQTFLMDKPYNNNSELPRVNNWKEFYEIVNSMSKKRTMLDTDEFCDIK